MNAGDIWRVIIVSISIFVILVHTATVWFEEPPSLYNPCTIKIAQGPKGDMDHYHPVTECRNGGLYWFATFGRVHLHFYYDSEPDDLKRKDFELCLTAGAQERVYVWWDSRNNSWSPISFPLWHGPTDKTDWCKLSQNGTMDLFLEPPWAFINYVVHVSWSIRFLEELTPEEIEELQPKPRTDQGEWPEVPDDPNYGPPRKDKTQ